MEEIRKQIKAKREKVDRYNNRINQYQQNITFGDNEGMFYKHWMVNEKINSTPDDDDEGREFWRKKIWGINKVHKDDEWLSNIKSELWDLDHEEDIIISRKDLKKILQKLPHWKALGKDGLQEYWTKAFNSLQDQLLNFLNLCLQSALIPDWMIWGKTVLVQKDLSKGITTSNYQPITCLPNI